MKKLLLLILTILLSFSVSADICDDTQPPVLTGVPADITTCAIPPPSIVDARDDCPGVTLSFSEILNTPTHLIRTWTATDLSGKETSGTQNIFINCAPITCFGIPNFDPSVCSGFGTCVDQDTCLCPLGFTGPQCEMPSCSGIPAEHPASCGPAGQCIGPDDCECQPGYIGPNCELMEFACFGFPPDAPEVCSGVGVCIGQDICDCHEGFAGPQCETPLCIDMEPPMFDVELQDLNVCELPKPQKVGVTDDCPGINMEFQEVKVNDNHYTRTWTATDSVQNTIEMVQEIYLNCDVPEFTTLGLLIALSSVGLIIWKKR